MIMLMDRRFSCFLLSMTLCLSLYLSVTDLFAKQADPAPGRTMTQQTIKERQFWITAGITINNFCIAIHGNEPGCTSCHAGYGWEEVEEKAEIQEWETKKLYQN